MPGGEQQVPSYWGLGVMPFLGLLAAIAVLPLMKTTRHWWERNVNRLIVSAICACLTVAYFLLTSRAVEIPQLLKHVIVDDYLPFIILLFSLYVISGGINLSGDLPAHAATNTAFLATGAVLANFIGTTGASMLLIRPLLQTNSERRHVTHTVIFFIFIVSNVGGCLLPIGDPPLFLGYLRGVPFLWTLVLWKEWAFCTLALLIVYFIWDSRAYKKEAIANIQRDEAIREPLRLRGSINFIWLAGIVLAVAFLDHNKPVPGTTWQPFALLREIVMLSFVAISLLTTPRGVRQANRFSYAPILEVAALFIGIFITMRVPLEVLQAQGARLGLNQPWEYFWATGMLSSLLDNAPTYIVFFQTANTLTTEPGPGILQLVNGKYMRTDLLIAISLGAVFMGANTYIGNGPNFMVKSIAEQAGVKMPGFLGYMFYSGMILLPLFGLVTLLFLL